MERLILECAIRAALLVAATAIILLLLRVKDAATKHKVWAAVLLVMLALPAWTIWGPKAPVRILPPLPEPTPIAATLPAIQSSAPDLPQLEINVPASTAAHAPTAQPTRGTWQTFLLGVYLLGAAALLSRLVIGAARARQLIRRATLRDGQLTSAACAAPVTVGWFRPRMILPEDCRDWTQAKLDAVLTHEGEHARRHDPALQALALLNRAIFWFHPAAWWLEHRISTLAEEACDDVVLARGHSPSDYSEYLMDMARAVMQSGARVNIAGVTMPGSSLPRRIKRIIEGVHAVPVSRARMACVAAACVLTCAAFAAGKIDHTLVGDPMRAPQQQANGVPSPSADLPRFDSVSITPRTSGPDLWPRSDGSQGLFRTTITLRNLLAWAYPVQSAQGRAILRNPGSHSHQGLWNAVIPGAPDWLDSLRFDIEARTERKPTGEQWDLMIQALLADRFKLAVHYETEVVPVYGLELWEPGKFGPQLRRHVSDRMSCWDPTAAQPPPSVAGQPTLPYCGGFRIPVADYFILENPRNLTTENMANYFTEMLDRPVIDRTGLTGTFDFDLLWARRRTNDPLPLFAALQQELGLRFVPMNGPIKVFVIDHVEKPASDQPAQASTPRDASPSPQFIDTVVFDGNRRISSQELQSRIFTRIGDYYSDEVLRKDYTALWNSQFFDNIQLEVQDSPDRPAGKIVIFHLRERPTIASLDYVGFTSVTREEILERFRKEQLNVTVESLLDPTKVRRAEDVLKALLAEHGHQSAVVRGGVATIPATNRVRLVFTAAEEPTSAPAQTTPSAARPSFDSVITTQVSGAAQQPLQTLDGQPFELVSLKRNQSGSQYFMGRLEPDGYRGVNVSVQFLIDAAYEITQPSQAFAAPEWRPLLGQRFDIEIKANGGVNVDQLRPALQSLLADRFKLAVHHEMRQSPQNGLVDMLVIDRLEQPSEDKLVPGSSDVAANPLPGPVPLQRPAVSRAQASGASFPSCVYCPEPLHAADGGEGPVVLQAVIQPDGRATNIQVAVAASEVLNTEAIIAVGTWRFRPANGPDGKPIAAVTLLEVNFHRN